MTKRLKAIAAAAVIGLGTMSLAVPAQAGWHHYHHGGGWVGAGIAGLAAGAIIGSALAAPPPPPPPYYGPAYYGPAAYGPPPWSPAWYNYCSGRYRTFNPRTGYFIGYDGEPHFCR